MKKTTIALLIAFGLAGCKKLDDGQGAETITESAKNKQQVSAITPFSIIIMPDTQYEVSGTSGGNNGMLDAQMDWIIENKAAYNIAFVAGVGDIVNTPTNTTQWDFAKTQYHRLTSANIRWGVAVGNHDQTGYGNPIGSTTSNYNARFGRTTYFHDKLWYGGSYEGAGSNNNDNYYCLFSQSGIDFVVVFVEYDDGGDSNAALLQNTAINSWVNDVLTTYQSRKAIIVSHSIVNSSGNFSVQGQPLYDAIKARENVFLMYSGHFYEPSHRSDTFGGNTINSFMVNYQDESHGGGGYLRILQFTPDNNQVAASTYSRYLGNSLSSSEDQFTHQMFTNSYVLPTILTPTADAHVRNGSFANTNYGTATTLVHCNSGTAGSAYKSYLKFDLSGITSPIKYAKLKLTGDAATTGSNFTGSNCWATADGWTEAGITWNNAPAASGSTLRSNQINATDAVTRDYDVTAYVQAEKAGDNTASFVLNSSSSIAVTQFSKEYGTPGQRAQLLIYY